MAGPRGVPAGRRRGRLVVAPSRPAHSRPGRARDDPRGRHPGRRPERLRLRDGAPARDRVVQDHGQGRRGQRRRGDGGPRGPDPRAPGRRDVPRGAGAQRGAGRGRPSRGPRERGPPRRGAADVERADAGFTELHGAGAGVGATGGGECSERRLWFGGVDLSFDDRAGSVRIGDGGGDFAAGASGRSGGSAGVEPEFAAGHGDDLFEMFAEGSGEAISDGVGSSGGIGAIFGRSTDCGAAGEPN